MQPIPPAIDWLEASKIADNLWSRLYEVDSNKPIYGDRLAGKIIHYDYEKISEKEQSSYAWRGSYGIESAVRYYDEVKSLGADRYNAKRTTPLTPEQTKKKAERLAPEVEKVIAALDDKGRWLENEMIYSQVFVRNVILLCDYLELFNP